MKTLGIKHNHFIIISTSIVYIIAFVLVFMINENYSDKNVLPVYAIFAALLIMLTAFSISGWHKGYKIEAYVVNQFVLVDEAKTEAQAVELVKKYKLRYTYARYEMR